jgi:aryl-alcohol dehydrogenase-like predicted oxidoreductase
VEYRSFGRLGRISALTLGVGVGGVGGARSATDRAEAVATVHAAVACGVTMLDITPGNEPDRPAETLVGEALRTSTSAAVRDVHVATTITLPADEPGNVVERMTRSLYTSLDRLGRDYVDLLLLDSPLCPPTGGAVPPGTLGWATYVDQVVPTFLALRDELLIRGWGLTGVGDPRLVLRALGTQPRPDTVHVTVDALEPFGDSSVLGAQDRQHALEMIHAAAPDVPVVAVRGSRGVVIGDHTDRRRVTAVRALAAEFGTSATVLAHRYALSLPGIATIVLGVGNRGELAEWLEAERRGPLTDTELLAVRHLHSEQWTSGRAGTGRGTGGPT